MNRTPSALSFALSGLARALDDDRDGALEQGRWRWQVRRRMADVRDALLGEVALTADASLAVRGRVARRERQVLLDRLAALGPRVLEEPDVEPVRKALQRFVVDVGHHRQRLHDLAYDDVELELGGSE